VLVNNAGSADISAFEDYPDTQRFRKTVVMYSINVHMNIDFAEWAICCFMECLLHSHEGG
jgi:hypothetical protein